MGYFKPNTKGAIKLAVAVKSLTVGMAGLAYFSGNPHYIMWIGMTGLAANEVINFLSDATKEDAKCETKFPEH